MTIVLDAKTAAHTSEKSEVIAQCQEMPVIPVVIAMDKEIINM
jgi:hypothetical protein